MCDRKLVNEILNQILGACPRIDIFSQIKAFFENKHRHTPSISSIIFKK